MIANRVRMGKVKKGETSKPRLSYAILTDGSRIDFEIENTPIENFCGYDAESVNINGRSYTKTIIKEIHLGDSYRGVTEIGYFFLNDCPSLTDVTLGLSTLNIINNNFLQKCPSLLSVMLDSPALNSIGIGFISNCTSLIDVTLTAETPPNIGAYLLFGTNPSLSIYVPANSVNDYKTATNWNEYTNRISGI